MIKTSNTTAKKYHSAHDTPFCRTCYDHLAGFAGVTLTEALEKKKLLQKSGKLYVVTPKGWEWLAKFEIYPEDFVASRRPLARQCLDCTEKRPHLAGQLGAAFLHKLLENKWIERIPDSRGITVTSKGRRQFSDGLGISL